MNLGDYAAYWAKMRGEQPAAVFGDETLSWAELNRQADGVAAALQQLGVGKGDRVACLLTNCMEWALTYIATLKAGAILVPLNTGYGDGQLREIEQQADCSVVVSRPGFMVKLLPELSTTDDVVCLYPRKSAQPAVALRRAAVSGAVPTDVRVAPDDVAIISYTSGSTGLPKGVMLTHVGIVAFATSQILALRMTSEEQVLLIAPFAFTGGVISVFTPAYVVGACVHIEDTLNPARIFDLIVERRITQLTAVPIFYERIAAIPGFAGADISCLRLPITGGAPVSESLLKLYNDKGVCIRQVYGCTEGCGLLAMPTEQYALEKPWSCGWPLPTVQIRLIDAGDQPCAVGEAGEILLRGVQVMKGYWRNEKADSEAWLDGWFRTGDMGVFDELGHLKLVDRKKNMIISGGVNIYPAEIEREMAAIPGLAEILAFGRPDKVWGERVVAVVYGPGALDAVALLAESRRLLGGYKAPKELIVSRKPLPRTPSGKLPRNDLDQLYAALADEPHASMDDLKAAPQ